MHHLGVACLDDQSIVDLVEGRLGPEARRSAQEHLHECVPCRELVAGSAAALLSTLDTVDEGRRWPAPLGPSSHIGRYRILDLVGSGGMGVVYSAYDPELDRRVALKLVRTAADEESQRSRLLREARAIARVAHPNVVAVHDAGTISDRVFIAMEFVEGATLTSWLASAKRSLAERLERLAQAGRGLAAAHRAGLVHRDFKPDNVLVGRDGRVRVTDFGLARPQAEHDPQAAASGDELLRSPDVPLTQTGAFVGTPAYMAPEQMGGEPIDLRSDVFSFCVAAWECLYGSRPFSGRSAEELLRATREGALPDPPAGNLVPARLRRLLARGLHHSPAARPSLEELLAELAPPSRGRSRALVVLGAAALIALALVGLRLQQQARNRAMCRGGAGRLAGVWDVARKQSLLKALGSRDPAMIGGLEAALDHYAGEWARDYGEACEATHLRGEQSAESLELRMECLDQRRRELDAFVVSLTEDPERLADAAVAAHRLPPLSECDNVTALRNIIRPSVPAAELDAMRTRLARLLALRYVSALKNKGDEARALAEEARRGGALDIAAQAMQVQAAAARANDEFAASSDYYRSAALMAGMARDDLTLARILMHGAELEGPIRANLKPAFELIDFATTVVGRLGANPALQSELLSIRGQVEWRADRLKDAEEHDRQALALFKRTGDNDPIHHAYLLLILADCVGDQGRFDESLPLYQEALALYHDSLGDDHVMTLQLRNNLALDLYESGRDADAVELERAVVAGYERRGDAMGIANALWTLGLFVESEKLAEAEALYRRSLALYEKTVGRDMVDLCYPLTGLGRLALAHGRPGEAVVFLERALALQNAPELRDSTDRAETELALAQALASGPRALALATHARDVLKARPAGPRRAALVGQAQRLVATLSHR